MCVLTILDYTNIWSYAKMLFVIQNCVKSLLRKDKKVRTCKRIVLKIKAITLMNSLFRKGIKLLSRGKSKLYAFTQNKETSTCQFFDARARAYPNECHVSLCPKKLILFGRISKRRIAARVPHTLSCGASTPRVNSFFQTFR